MFFQDFRYWIMDLKIINSVTFSPEIAKSLKRRAKQQRWRLWYFVIICFPFFFAKAECTGVPKAKGLLSLDCHCFWKNYRKLQTNWASYLVTSLSFAYRSTYQLHNCSVEILSTKGINIEIDFFKFSLLFLTCCDRFLNTF